MLQKEPLQSRNLKIDRRSQQPADLEDRGDNQNLPVQDVRISGNIPRNVDKTKTIHPGMGEPTPRISAPLPFVEQSATPETKEDEESLSVDFLQELGQLENLILDSVRVPLTELVVIDEGVILEQIDSIRKQIPHEVAIANALVQRKAEILQKAQDYARNLIDSAHKQAERIIQKSALIRQAELEATRIQVETERECQQMRRQTQEEIQQWRELAIADYENVQNGADEYARNVLGNLEGQLGQMLGIIRNGYQQLEPKTAQDKSNHRQQ